MGYTVEKPDWGQGVSGEVGVEVGGRWVWMAVGAHKVVGTVVKHIRRCIHTRTGAHLHSTTRNREKISIPTKQGKTH